METTEWQDRNEQHLVGLLSDLAVMAKSAPFVRQRGSRFGRGEKSSNLSNAPGLSGDQMDAEISVARGVRIVRVVRYEILVGMTGSQYELKSLPNGGNLRDTP